MSVYETIREEIESAGGRAYMVGGSVRDMLCGHIYKDIDTEVYGMSADALVGVLGRFGEVNTVGASFGVIKLRAGGEEFDFSLPRRDSRVGVGHRGFMVEVDHTMTVSEAARRRDFTINAISVDRAGCIIDPYGGVDDLRARRLRHTSEAFAEDPLRVLRGFQFAGRMRLTVTRPTAALCRSLIREYPTLARERVWGEWEKWASKSETPSLGLEFLVSTGWVALYPEIAAMLRVPQDQEWHPEGSVYLHTKHVVDAAMAIARREGLSAERRATLVFAALCHDMGKPATTQRSETSGRWVAPGHAEAGVEPARRFMESIGAPRAMIEEVAELVAFHMRHIGFTGGRAARRLAATMKATTPYMLGLIMEADHSGRPWTGEFIMPADGAAFVAEMDAAMTAVQPILMGRHLIAVGMRPGPAMGRVLRMVHEAQVEGEVASFDQALAMAMRLAA
ncbi:MAG: HD domain-containing protein [Vampirovibrionales bacterium]|nr:HD domain-containing protein [Vampirovibrionales bacterium]